MSPSTSVLLPEPGLPVTPINRIPNVPLKQLVHVRGTVMARDPGYQVRIRDLGGELDLMTGQMRPVSIGETIDAIGYPVSNGLEWRLQNAIFREESESVTVSASRNDPAQAIGLAAGVMELSADEAAQGRPVRLTGVVTWSNAKAPFFFIQDSSGGVCVQRGASTARVSSPGRNVAVIGRTGLGPFAPVVVAASFEGVSSAIVPKGRPVSLEHALRGAEEGQWVEMRGYLRRIAREGDWNYLELATGTEDFTAVLPATEDASSMIGSVIRLHGVCTAEADSRRKLTGIKLWVPGIAYVQVEEEAPSDPFAVPARSLSSLGQYETVQAFNRRVRVTGTVLRQQPGHSINLADGGHSLLALTPGRTPVRAGDRVEAVGFLGRQGGRVTLSEVVYRVMEHGPEPVAQTFEPGDQPSSELDGQLVVIKGTVLSSARLGQFVQFTIGTTRKIFEATLEQQDGEFALPATGSSVTLTGVYVVGYDERSRADSFMLRLRAPADVVVLETPSWWTRARLLAFSGVIALGALGFLAWITALRRQVGRQTDQIRRQLEREARLQGELARAGKLDSLGLLAGGIAHDFNNLLTVLIGNMSLLRLDAKLNADASRSLEHAEKAAARARDLTQQLLTFAKGGAPLRVAVSLPEIVREVAEFALRGSKVRSEFAVSADLWPANVDKGQIGQVVQNIVINALQAMPDGGVVNITLANREVGRELAGVLAPGRYVLMDFADHGPGIPAADLARIFDPFFRVEEARNTNGGGSGLGLSIAKRAVHLHRGSIAAENATPGLRVTIVIPLTHQEAIKTA